MQHLSWSNFYSQCPNLVFTTFKAYAYCFFFSSGAKLVHKPVKLYRNDIGKSSSILILFILISNQMAYINI